MKVIFFGRGGRFFFAQNITQASFKDLCPIYSNKKLYLRSNNFFEHSINDSRRKTLLNGAGDSLVAVKTKAWKLPDSIKWIGTMSLKKPEEAEEEEEPEDEDEEEADAGPAGSGDKIIENTVLETNDELGQSVNQYLGWKCSWRKDNHDTPKRQQIYIKQQRALEIFKEETYEPGARHRGVIAEEREAARIKKNAKDLGQRREDAR